MFVGFGTLINLLGIAGGSLLGVLFGNRIPEKTRSLITDALGCVTILAAADALREIWSPSFIATHNSRFIEGFMAASLLFAIGPLAILGSISDGMGNGDQQLILKSSLDAITSVAFASTFVWGVLASIVPVGIYQLLWTFSGWGLGNIMSPYQVSAMTATGGILLIGIALRILGIKQMEVGNLLPAILFAPLIATCAHHFL